MLNKLKSMLNGNWKYSEGQNNEGNYIVLTKAGDIIAIYPAEEGEGLELYYKSDLSLDTLEYYPKTAVAAFTLINELF